MANTISRGACAGNTNMALTQRYSTSSTHTAAYEHTNAYGTAHGTRHTSHHTIPYHTISHHTTAHRTPPSLGQSRDHTSSLPTSSARVYFIAFLQHSGPTTLLLTAELDKSGHFFPRASRRITAAAAAAARAGAALLRGVLRNVWRRLPTTTVAITVRRCGGTPAINCL